MDAWLHASDSKVLRSLIESEETPRSPHLCSIAVRALVLRTDLKKEIENPAFHAWVKRNLKLLAALELDKGTLLKRAFPTASQNVIDRMICSCAPVKTLLQYCRFADPPRHSHVSEVLLGQRRIMRWILQYHPFPALHLRNEWVMKFEEDWLAALTIIPCVCNYQHALSTTTKEEICSAQCKRREQLTGLILGDLHGLSTAGVAKLCKNAHKNTFPLSNRPLGPSKPS